MVSSVPTALEQESLDLDMLESQENNSSLDQNASDMKRMQAPPSIGLREYFGNIYNAVTTIFSGLAITKSWLFRRPSTVQYPDKIEKPVQEMLPSTYRGILEVDLGLCTGCMLCGRTCPIGTIDLKVEKNAETGQREITLFDIDIGQCMFCGLCVEACKFGALVHTTEFEASAPNIQDLMLHFVKTPQPVAKYKPSEAPERHRPGTILSQVIIPYGKRKPVYQPEDRPQKPSAPAQPTETEPSETKARDTGAEEQEK